VRDAVVDGIAVAVGDGIALVDGVLVARADDIDQAMLMGLTTADVASAALVTVYLGRDAPAGAREHVVSVIANEYPELELDVLAGGQPFYPYVLSVE
jgi:uncharacterized protein